MDFSLRLTSACLADYNHKLVSRFPMAAPGKEINRYDSKPEFRCSLTTVDRPQFWPVGS